MNNALNSRLLAAVALMAALTAVGAWLRIPVPYVPFTLQMSFVYLSGVWLGARYGALAQLVYISAGLVGFPIFAKGGGPHYVLEPSFGYIIWSFVKSDTRKNPGSRRRRCNQSSHRRKTWRCTFCFHRNCFRIMGGTTKF